MSVPSAPVGHHDGVTSRFINKLYQVLKMNEVALSGDRADPHLRRLEDELDKRLLDHHTSK